MKHSKKIGLILLCILSLLCFSLGIGCNSQTTIDVSKLDTTPSGALETWFEFMSDGEIKSSDLGISERDVVDGKVTFVFTSPEYEVSGEKKSDVYVSQFPGVYCNVAGTWKVTYVIGGKATTKTFEVKDTIKPTFSVAQHPYDVWADGGETSYPLPFILPEDDSEFDYDTLEQTLTLTSLDGQTEYVRILPGESYKATKVGRLDYTMTIADIHGNSSTFSTSWNSKDPNWVDENLQENYLADYDEPEYINAAQSGNMASYWQKSEIKEQWLEEHKGANGVLKVTASPNTYSLAAFGFKIFKPLTQADLAGKYFTVKYMTDNNNTIRFGCKTYQVEKRGVEATHSYAIENNVGEWNYAVIPAGELKFGYFDLDDEYIDFFQIAVGNYHAGNTLTSDAVVYLDSVTLAEQLDDVSGLTISGETLTWNAVDNADAYEVYEGDKMTVVRTNQYTVTDIDAVNDMSAIVKVRAISDKKELYLASAKASILVEAAAASLPEGYIANFSHDVYTQFVEDRVSTLSHRYPSSKKASVVELDGVGKVLKVDITANLIGCADFVVQLPKVATSGKMTIKVMVETDETNLTHYVRFAKAGAESGLYVSNSGGKTNTIIAGETTAQSLVGFADALTTKGEWLTVSLDSGIASQIDLMIGSATSGANYTVYFAYAFDGTQNDMVKADLAKSLNENELANYNSEDYVDFVHLVNGNPSSGDSIDVEYLAEFEGETGVLKITYHNNSGSDAGIAFELIKPLADGASADYTIKLRFGDSDKVPAAVRMRCCNSFGTVGSVDEWGDSGSPKLVGTKGDWLTKCVTTVGQAKNCLTFYTYCPGTTQFVLYIATIMSGNQTANV